MLSTGLFAIDSTILATAVPSIVSDLGGFTSFPWLFSIYLLAQAISVPIYGKLADLYGRKPLMLLGVGLFVVGSLLCGFAWSMTGADRLPARAGPRCRRDRPDRDDDPRRHLLAAGAGDRAGLPGQRLGDGGPDRADPRRGVLRHDRVAVDLLRQPAARRGGDVDALAPVPRAGRAQASTGSTTSAPRCSASAARCSCWLCSRAASSGRGTRRPASGCSRPPWCCSAAFVLVERRAAEPVLPLWVFRMRVLNVSNAGSLRRRRADAGSLVVRAAVLAEGAGHRRRGGRTGPGGDDDRLADRGRDRGPALPDGSASGSPSCSAARSRSSAR